MGLQFILGRAGTGKSEYILNEVKKKIDLGKKIYIITPEQFSYVTEKKLLDSLQKSSVLSAEVVSFDLLARRNLTEVRWKS